MTALRHTLVTAALFAERINGMRSLSNDVRTNAAELLKALRIELLRLPDDQATS